MTNATNIVPRVIPSLQLDGDALVKTTRFAEPQYVGDPNNVLSIFSALEVDEIVLLGIRVRSRGSPPPFGLLGRLAEECLIPLSYGGGLTSLDDVRQLVELGYEKAVINSALITTPSVVTNAAEVFGSQAIVASIDAVEQPSGSYEVVTGAGSRFAGIDPATLARRAQDLGAGEILVTSVDRDGTMGGYDLALIESVSSVVSIPVIACGGADSRASLAGPVVHAGASAVAAGSLFIYQGQNRSVLINFPTRSERAAIFSQRD